MKGKMGIKDGRKDRKMAIKGRRTDMAMDDASGGDERK